MVLSVLDQSPVPSGATPAQALTNTLELARVCDRLGYHRYWVAEHHSTAALAGSSPEILIARIASENARIRVGAGGVMLTHYSPLKVAENFRILETLYPGRIDLGIGRAPGSDARTARALRYGADVGLEQFPEQVADVIAFVRDAVPDDHPFRGVRAMPTGPGTPQIWLLGSSGDSGRLAAHFGTAFAFAHFINADGGADVMRAYYRDFRASAALAAPYGSVAVFVVCAETTREAERLAQSRDLFLVRLYTGRGGRYPSVQDAESHPYTAHERLIVEHARARRVAGDPEAVKARLDDMAADYGVGEIVVVTITHDFKARVRSYELLAEAFGLPG